MRPRAFFNTSKLMLPGAVIGAMYGPGFSADLSSWRLMIDEEGHLFQDVDVCRYTGPGNRLEERRRHEVAIGQEPVLKLLMLAESLGFYELEPKYEAQITDMGMFTLAVHCGERQHTVSAYGAEWLSHNGHTEMKRFLRLWEAIHAYAPFPEKS